MAKGGEGGSTDGAESTQDRDGPESAAFCYYLLVLSLSRQSAHLFQGASVLVGGGGLRPYVLPVFEPGGGILDAVVDAQGAAVEGMGPALPREAHGALVDGMPLSWGAVAC